MKTDDRLAARDKAVRSKLFCNTRIGPGTVSGVEVGVVRDGGGLAVEYFVHGDIRALPLPERTRSEHVSFMESVSWQQTSFELKVAGRADLGYYLYAFNFAGDWTCDALGRYFGTLEPGRVTPPSPDVRVSDELLHFSVRLAAEHLPALPPDRDWRAAVSATIEEGGGRQWWDLCFDPPLGPEFPYDRSILVLPPRNVVSPG